MIYCKHYWIWEMVWHSDHSDVTSKSEKSKNGWRKKLLKLHEKIPLQRWEEIQIKNTEGGKGRCSIKPGGLFIKHSKCANTYWELSDMNMRKHSLWSDNTKNFKPHLKCHQTEFHLASKLSSVHFFFSHSCYKVQLSLKSVFIRPHLEIVPLSNMSCWVIWCSLLI